ncbi:MAG: class II aldolase/adducin family protein [Anaerolineae bacterium]|nr:class II aldolase/adducin family protein [Anaerolineae bacterium]
MEDSVEIRQAIIDTCLECVRLGYFIGTWGNVSARCGDRLLVTPTRVDYDKITPADIVLVDLASGQRVAGERLPSSEMQLHRAIYRARPDLGAIVHSHSTYASIVSTMRLGIPCLLEDMAQLIGEVRCAPYVRGGEHQALAAGAAAHIGQANAVLLANHGPICCGRNLAEAVLVNQVLEKSALAFLWVSGSPSRMRVIPAEAVALEHYRYFHTYGKATDFPR